MATKKTTKKTAKKTTKKPAKKPVSKKKTTSKATAPRASANKTASKKTTTSKTTKKPDTKKAPTKQAPTKKATTKKAPAKKAPTTKTAASASKKPATVKKPASKKPLVKKAPVKKAESPAPKKTSKPTPQKGGKPTGAGQTTKPADEKKTGRKGITIVENRPKKKSAGKQKITPPTGTLGSLLAKRRRQPLIPSGPNAPASPYGEFGATDDIAASGKKAKSPFKKRELDAFRERLIEKRRALAGDIAEMEREMADRGDRGGNPALDVAEQGSDAYDQSLSIGLAEADRRIIREIDLALKRIDDGVFGLCEVTRKPIGIERLREIPWARLSIEAARDIEQRGMPR